MEKAIAPFEVRQCASILKSTGEKAKKLRELREIIARVGDEAIFHYTYQYFLKGHNLHNAFRIAFISDC